MSNKKDENEIIIDDEGAPETVTLCDEEGQEFEFEVVGACIDKGVQYFALIPKGSADEDGGFSEFIVFKQVPGKDGENDLVEIEDDAEFDRIAEKFIDAFNTETDYD